MKITPKEARKLSCPVARTFHAKKGGNCMADDCILWRWSLMADMRFISATKREAALMAKEWNDTNPGAKKPKTESSFHTEATSRVTQCPQDYLVLNDDKDRGYCGLGGKI